MKTLLSDLWHETRGGFDRLPVWLPGTSMRLGDIGVFGDGGWTTHTTLSALGIPFSVGPVGVPTSFDYASSDGAEVRSWVGANGEPLPGMVSGNAGLRIRFSRAGAFVLKAGAVRTRQIVELDTLDGLLVQRYQRGDWRREWVLVTEVAQGGPVLILVSASADGEAVVDLGVKAVAAGAPLAGGGTGVSVGSSRGLAATFTSQRQTTVLWRGRCVQDRWWQDGPRIEATRGREDGPGMVGPSATAAEPTVIEVEYPEDLSESR
ncbi:hypothetical protein GA0070624_3975 [Micromonospora rhizosphaerae]|uniref:Uncharacterized protein n=1 Tax=Micromonospora rhizosphaerae TaxID=568872 RepID=A0A1C6SKG4_9ACTN|nr:hypothetical protein [Micromonospora rhizosphaerae]SCL29917.1 hypothetical protein GA0070624_3975 [Micromonospora rhizosphaerae]